MPIKRLAVMIIILIIAWLLMINEEPLMLEPKASLPVGINPVVEGLAANKHHSNNNNTVVVSQEIDQNKSDVLAEITPHLFSADPYMELLSLRKILSPCLDINNINQLFTIYGELHPNQIDLSKQLELDCQQYTKRYPLLMSIMKDQDWLTTYEPQSDLGQLMKNRKKYTESVERRSINQQILQASLSAENSAMLLYANRITQHDSIDLSQQTTAIDSKDYLYTQQVNHIAINIMACKHQDGMACQTTSGLMLSICAQFPSACGSDYLSWYQNNTLAGMKKDVEILIKHLMARYP